MLNYDLSQIAKEMKQHYPGSKYRSINHLDIISKYLRLIQTYIQQGILRATADQLDDNIIPVEWRKIRMSCGTYGKRQYWFDWIQQHYPLITSITKGYKFGAQGTLTMVKTTLDVEIILAAQDPIQTVKAFYANCTEDTEYDDVPIDLRSLGMFIEHNKHIQPNNDNHAKALKRNLRDAKIIYDIASCCDGVLSQIVKESVFGRKYYTGINLQNVSKQVRHAALGDCHQYDIESSVFNWKLDAVQTIDPEIKLPATLEYFEYKSRKRSDLAFLVFGNHSETSINTIKSAITAVGFGARATNACWKNENGRWTNTALKDIIYSQDKLNKFLTDPWMVEFVEEQNAINKLIFDDLKAAGTFNNVKELHHANGQLIKSKSLAWAYQHCERATITQLMNEANSSQVLLVVHDGFYTKYPAKLVNLRECLRNLSPNGKIEHVAHSSYSHSIDAVEDLAKHRRMIEEETKKAYGGIIPNHIIANQRRIDNIKQQQRKYTASDEFYCINQQESNYDYELDPFYMQE